MPAQFWLGVRPASGGPIGVLIHNLFKQRTTYKRLQRLVTPITDFKVINQYRLNRRMACRVPSERLHVLLKSTLTTG